MAASVLRVQPQVAQDHAPGGTLISKNPVTTARWIEALMENSSMVRLERTPSMKMNRCAPLAQAPRATDAIQVKRGGEDREPGAPARIECRGPGPPVPRSPAR